jgi:N-acylneuraminate cytidylyltransferase
MNVAIIPARGGSKRIPRKNIKEFCGKPMIAWSIEAALQSECFDRVVVSTEDAEIAEVARAHGAEVPFERPAALANDHAGTVSVIAHAAGELDLFPKAPVCCIYATAPFVQPTDIRLGLEALQATDADYALSVTTYAFPIQRALKITGSGRVAMFQPENAERRSQDLEEAWHDAGQFYWGRGETWLAGKAPLASDAVPVRVPRERVQDIDTPEDWRRAEWLFKAMRAHEDGED